MADSFKVLNLHSQIERGPFDSRGEALDYLRGTGRVGVIDEVISDHVVLRCRGDDDQYRVVLAGDQLIAAVAARD